MTQGVHYIFLLFSVVAACNRTALVPGSSSLLTSPSAVSVQSLIGAARVSWRALPGDGLTYNVYVSTDPRIGAENYVALGGERRISATSSPVDVLDLDANTPYYFVITAMRGEVESAPSVAISTTPIAIAMGPSREPFFTFEGEQSGAHFGAETRTADLDQDGYDDVVIGAFRYRNPAGGEGAVFGFRGGPSGVESEPSWRLDGPVAPSAFGLSLAVGDVNGDGFKEVLVGAPELSEGFTSQGAAFLYAGSRSGPTNSSLLWSAIGTQAGARFGHDVAMADVDGDGDADIVVSAPDDSSGEALEGSVSVYTSGPGAVSGEPTWFAQGDQQNASFGFAIANAGDVDGNGQEDLLIAATGYDVLGSPVDEGRVFLYTGDAAGLKNASAFSYGGGQAGAQIGFSVAGLEDVNGDGYSDFAVGAQGFDVDLNEDSVPELDIGTTVVFLGGPSPSELVAHAELVGSQRDGGFGNAVASAGDVNGDGFSDLFISESRFDGVFQDQGHAWVYAGSPAGLLEAHSWRVAGQNAGGRFGFRPSAGDVDGDGSADLVVGSHFYSHGESEEGAVYVFRGAASTGPLISVDNLSDPLDGNSTTPIQSLSFADAGLVTHRCELLWDNQDTEVIEPCVLRDLPKLERVPEVRPTSLLLRVTSTDGRIAEAALRFSQ